MKLTIALQMPEQRQPMQPEECKPSVEEQVRDCLDLIDSGHESAVEWNMIRRLYRELQSRERSPRIENLMQMIEPVLSKFGYHKKV